MTSAPAVAPSEIYPCQQYEDAHAAVAFLQRSFGFRPRLIVPDDHGGIAHGELHLGRGVVMIGSRGEDEWRFRTPFEVSGAVTGGSYIAVPDIDEHFARADRSGAIIVRPLTNAPDGSRDYAARDREGFFWTFGSQTPRGGPLTTAELSAELIYTDVTAAARFICAAFGFSSLLVHDGADGTLAHANLAFGTSVVLLSGAREHAWQSVSPTSLQGAYTQSICVYVSDVDAHQRRAQSAGAEIVLPLAQTEYGSRSYSVRDPEGYIWTFGTYYPAP